MVGPLLLVLLAILLVFIVLHEGGESVGLETGALCLGFVLGFVLAALTRPPCPQPWDVAHVDSARAPPSLAVAARVPQVPRSVPLRL